MTINNAESISIWNDFSKNYTLSLEQLESFKRYADLLITANAQFNLTAITSVSRIVADHFKDSLSLKEFIDLSKLRMFADIGSGAGFPGLPLKILFPHIPVVLIEVIKKKRDFLAYVVEDLGLTDVIISELDWRTFLRKTDYPIDLFCARASLQAEELIRLFKPESSYKDATLVYWASRHWTPSSLVAPFIEREEQYTIEGKSRLYVFFSFKSAS